MRSPTVARTSPCDRRPRRRDPGCRAGRGRVPQQRRLPPRPRILPEVELRRGRARRLRDTPRHARRGVLRGARQSGLRLRRKHVFVRLPRQRGRREHRVARGVSAARRGRRTVCHQRRVRGDGPLLLQQDRLRRRERHLPAAARIRGLPGRSAARGVRLRSPELCEPVRGRLLWHVDRARRPLPAVARRAVSGRPQAGVASNPRSAAAGSGARISVSPTRIASTPASRSRATSAASGSPTRRRRSDRAGSRPQPDRQLTIDVERAQVAVVDADDLRARRDGARDLRARRAPRPARPSEPAREAEQRASILSSSAATISRMASAPAALASAT